MSIYPICEMRLHSLINAFSVSIYIVFIYTYSVQQIYKYTAKFQIRLCNYVGCCLHMACLFF